jgi:formylglycine-generating enzyme required for sulfatase activity
MTAAIASRQGTMPTFLLRSLTGLLLSLLVLAVIFGDDPAPPPQDDVVQKLIERLGTDDNPDREAATKELFLMGDRPLAFLRSAASESPNPETRWRAQHILTQPTRQSPAIGLTLRLIKPGELRQGSPDSETGRWPDEEQHETRISQAFYLGMYEVSQSEYRQVMKLDPSAFAAGGDMNVKVAGMATDNFPVDKVGWYDAIQFCNELSRLDKFQLYYQLTDVVRDGDSIISAKVAIRGGHGYRLPTEAEWEFACRAESVSPYHYGQAMNGNAANLKGATIPGGYGGEIRGPNLQRTCPRGSYAPNAWGLYDMHGNVGEWCWDYYEKGYYAVAPHKDPTGPATGMHRVWRGGSWMVGETSCRSASRNSHTPDERKDYLGFRIARNP